MLNKYFKVGFVKEIRANKIIIQLYETNNSFVYFYNGQEYSGISIGGYIGIINGPHTVVAQVDKEFLEDMYKDVHDQSFERERYVRLAEATVVGYFDIQEDKYIPGLKILPMIYNEAILLSQAEVLNILSHSGIGKKAESKEDEKKDKEKIKETDIDYPIVGNLVFHDIPFYLNWEKLFNTHIGIFGNTGSGKSNTLAKLYTELFNMRNSILPGIKNSQFIVLDFNGEYVSNNSFGISSKLEKSVIKLSTRSKVDQIRLSREDLLDVETLSILFSATDKTQKPFIKNAINYYKNNVSVEDDIVNLVGSCFYNTVKINTKQAYDSLLKIYKIIGIDVGDFENGDGINLKKFSQGLIMWSGGLNSLINKGGANADEKYIDRWDDKKISNERDELTSFLFSNKNQLKIDKLSVFEEIYLSFHVRLLYELYYGTYHYEHISPLLNRMESRISGLEKVICTQEVKNDIQDKFLYIISLKDCNIEMKKTLPLLLVKKAYDRQKTNFQQYKEGQNTGIITQLIIDEAHNILSAESMRETAQWKDYRLETFEELIKEGRKFGFYLTISSQRPSDISETIISQIHNYFIHRLVNENDLRIISNSISTLDTQSRQSIPFLAPGQCIVTGTSYYTPILVYMDQLDEEERPQSDDVDLKSIWSLKMIENKEEKGEDTENET